MLYFGLTKSFLPHSQDIGQQSCSPSRTILFLLSNDFFCSEDTPTARCTSPPQKWKKSDKKVLPSSPFEETSTARCTSAGSITTSWSTYLYQFCFSALLHGPRTCIMCVCHIPIHIYMGMFTPSHRYTRIIRTHPHTPNNETKDYPHYNRTHMYACIQSHIYTHVNTCVYVCLQCVHTRVYSLTYTYT